MKKLSKHDRERLTEAAANMASTYDDLDTLFNDFTEAAAKLFEELEGFQETAREVMDDAAMEADNYFDERSEKWQEDEAGERYGEWRDTLRQLADELAETQERPDISSPDRPDWLGQLDEQAFAEFEG
jgi:hypothetical protein